MYILIKADYDSYGIGDACFQDLDGDSSLDSFDTCPQNARIQRTDFRAIQPIAMGENVWNQPEPVWEFKNEGKEIHQEVVKRCFLIIFFS